MRILITTSSFGKEALQLCQQDNEVILNPFGTRLSGSRLLKLAKGVDGIIAGTETLDREILEKLPKLRVISRCGVGMENVDLKTASRLGIRVYNTPDAPTLAVAELTLCLILDLLRKVSLMDRNIRNGKWRKEVGNLLSGKKIGIIGFGRIGKKVAQLLIPFETNLAYYDIAAQDCNFARAFKSLNKLLAWADIISLHCSTAAHEALIGKREIKIMKKGSWLINVARGSLVDEEALYNVLTNDHLAGAALDVFEKEPYRGKLKGLENVILTPHIGSYAKEARIEMEIESVRNLLKGLKD